MTDQPHHILLLAHPGYHRNGIEATLLTMENVIVESATTCEMAKQILSKNRVDLFLVYPNKLDIQSICELSACFFQNKRSSVVLLTEPYREKINLEETCDLQVIEIETLDQLKNMIQAKLYQE